MAGGEKGEVFELLEFANAVAQGRAVDTLGALQLPAEATGAERSGCEARPGESQLMAAGRLKVISR